MAGAWTVLVHQHERRKQRSSAQVARCGIRSDMSRPDLPCFLNFRVLANSGVSPLVNWLTGMPKLGGSGLPCHFARAGLGSNRSTGLGPPTMNMKMTDFARAAKCGFFATSGLTGSFSAARPSRARSQDSASAPQPPPAWRRKSRRPGTHPLQWVGLLQSGGFTSAKGSALCMVGVSRAHPYAMDGERRLRVGTISSISGKVGGCPSIANKLRSRAKYFFPALALTPGLQLATFKGK